MYSGGGEVCARKGYSVHRVGSGEEVCARKGHSVHRGGGRGAIVAVGAAVASGGSWQRGQQKESNPFTFGLPSQLLMCIASVNNS